MQKTFVAFVLLFCLWSFTSVSRLWGQQPTVSHVPPVSPTMTLPPQQLKVCELASQAALAELNAKAPYGHQPVFGAASKPYRDQAAATLGPNLSFTGWVGVFAVDDQVGVANMASFRFTAFCPPRTPRIAMAQSKLRSIDDALVQAVGNTPQHAAYGYYSGIFLPNGKAEGEYRSPLIGMAGSGSTW